MNLTELQNEYFKLSGSCADRRWKKETLLERLETLRERARVAEQQRIEAEAARQKLMDERQERIERRGSVEDFTSNWKKVEDDPEDEQKFRYMLRNALRTIDQEKSEIEKFVKNIQENPLYALQWSKSVFELSAEAAVAREMVEFFENGQTYSEWMKAANTEALRKARSPAMSTSPTSNLVDTYLAAAWADAAENSWY
jgi:uncharacterized protein with von Willebrand factor type A (vWA) domain